jgi:hypothetical protein
VTSGERFVRPVRLSCLKGKNLLALANGALYLSRDKFGLVARSLDVSAQLRFKSRSPEPPSPSRALRASEATRYASSLPSGGQARR